MSNETDIVIIGAGMAGYGAAYHLHGLGITPRIYEQRNHLGGHTFSHRFDDGFIFDEGPHVSFTKNTRIQDIFAEAVGGEFQRLATYVDNYWQGHWIKHPAIVNLHGLPEELVVDCINDFVSLPSIEGTEIHNYADWLRACYGSTYAETFPFVYTRKYHTTDPENMTTDWIGKRLYRADSKEVIRGALTPKTPNVHYIDSFRYPTRGGFLSYLKPFENMGNFHFSHRVVSIDVSQRIVTFDNGHSTSYGALISSIPLTHLVPMIVGAPPEVVGASQRLACSKVVLVNVGLNQEECSPAHWRYVYDEDVPFARISFPHKFSRNTVPEGCCSIQVECYFSDKYKPLNMEADALIEPVIHHLQRLGLIEDPDAIIHRSAYLAEFANVIFDRERPEAVETVRGYLTEQGVHTCGRYGRWDYSWTDESFISGEGAAEAALSAAGHTGARLG